MPIVEQNPKLLLGEGLVVAVIWGIPLWLVFRAWRRYQQLDAVQSSLRLAISSLLVSEAVLLAVGVMVAIEVTSATRTLPSPQTLGVINFLLCAVALVSLFVTKTQDTIRVRRAITTASIYLMFVWLYAMLAH